MNSNNSEVISQEITSKFNLPILKFLEKSGIQFEAKGHCWYKMRSDEKDTFQPLTVEHWYEGKVMIVSICHYGEMNGDLMKDPEVVIRLDMESGIGIPVDFYQDFVGAYTTIFEEKEDGEKYTNPTKLASLQQFCETWAKNLEAQGHTITEREVELL